MNARRLAPFAPALLAALFAGWCGTLAGAVAWPASTVGLAALAALVAWQGPFWRDPLRLGSAGALLPLALLLSLWTSLAASPVPRAGWMGAALAPLFLCLPGAVAGCWASARDVSRGTRGLAVVVAAAALWSLVDGVVLGTARPAMPLGHHNLLAAWLVILAPLALVPLAERGAGRVVGVVALGLGIAAILASRSLAGAAGLAVEAALGTVIFFRRRRAALAVAALLLAILGMQAPRLADLAGAGDFSLRARLAYLRAGRDALLERPLVGWGPGSTPWIAAEHFVPVAGVNPPGEAVGDFHSLPLQAAVELGSFGFVLASLVVVAFIRRRLLRRGELVHPRLWQAAWLGLAGAGVVSLASASYAVTALPVAVAVVLGALLAAEPAAPRRSPLAAGLAAAVCLVLLAPLEIARFHYDRAVAGGGREERVGHLRNAVAWDPLFPLYRFRLALLLASEDRSAAAEEAWRAARLGRTVPLLWTGAGALGAGAGRPWARAAFEAACRAAPDQALPHFFLLTLDPDDPRAPLHGARALLAEPRLAAATFWRRRPGLWARSRDETLALPGLDPGWRASFAQRAPRPTPDGEAAEPVYLELAFDAQASESVSLYVFRRSPWPTKWPLVALAAAEVPRWDLGPAPVAAGLGRYPCGPPAASP